MRRHISIRGKRTLLVGATGSLGRELAVLLAEEECPLALVARNGERLRDLQSRLKGSGSAWWSCDIGSSASVFRTYREIIARFGEIDLAVFAAGIGIPMDSLHFDASVFEETLRVNLLAIGYWLECLIPEMVRRRSGHIVGVSSLAASRGLPMGAAYCPGKAGFSVLLECLRTDLAPFGIAVQTVEPGFYTSPMTEKLPHTPFIIPARRAAEELLAGMKRGSPRIRFPWTMRMYAAVVRSLPIWAYDRVMGQGHPVRASLAGREGG